MDLGLSATRDYVKTTASNVNSAEGLQMKKKAKGKEVSFDPRKPKRLSIFMSDRFPSWQDKYVTLVRESWNPATKTFTDEKDMLSKVGKLGDKTELKKAMQLIQALKKRLLAGESEDNVLERKLGFDERETIKLMIPGLIKRANVCWRRIIKDTSGWAWEYLLDHNEIASRRSRSVYQSSQFHFRRT